MGISLLFLCLVNPVSAVGVFRNTEGKWNLDYNNTGQNDKTFHFGTKGDIPVIGDWNKDGTSDVGVFRPSNGNWYLETTKTGVVYRTFHFGTTSDIPLIGDWNNDGTSDVGVFRPSNGNWYLDYNRDGVKDKEFHLGTKGDIPVVGDWDGNGISDTGVFRPSNGNWYLETTKTGAVNKTFHFGTIGDSPKSLQLPLRQTLVPVADFTSDVQSGNAPLTVRFTNRSTGTSPLTYAWDFTNDDRDDSDLSNPTFIYSTPGTYSVKLTVTNSAGSDTEIKNAYITVTTAPVPPVAAFTSDVRNGYAPLTVRFTNQSTGTAPLTCAWDFTNNDEDDSYLSNPTFTYDTPGTYTVKLTVTNSVGSDSEIKNGYITVNEVPVAPDADFFTNKRSGNAPLTVGFTDSSTGTAPLTYAWDFTNDGRDDSYLPNPAFTYDTPGTYTVKLTVTNDLGTSIARKTGYITVTEGQPGGSNAGIALTFDDNSIDQWYAIRNRLQQYNAHVTFFVTGFQNLPQYQIDELTQLQNDGHEIAFHGCNHEDATAYLQNHTIQQYLDYEIIPGVNAMRDAGLTPHDFAYPYGHENGSLTAALQAYFSHVRGTQSLINDPILYEYGSNQLLIEGVGIDDLSYDNTINEIYAAISRAKQEDKILVFYAHVPVETATGDYMLSYDRLDKILKNVSDNDMKFYTVSELT